MSLVLNAKASPVKSALLIVTVAVVVAICVLVSANIAIICNAKFSWQCS